MSTTDTTTTAVAGPTPPSCHYCTVADVQDCGGSNNVVTYSNLDGRKGDADWVRVQRVMTRVEGRITHYLKLNGIARPAMDDTGFALLTEACAWWILRGLYQARGDLDVQNDQEGQVSTATWDRDARRLLRLFVMERRGGSITAQFHVG